MSTLFNKAVKQQQLLRRDLEKLEAAPEDAPLALHGQISATITSLQRTVDSYAEFIKNETDSDKRKELEERVANFRAEITDSREKLRALKAKREESLAEANRQELFARRTAGAPSASENPFAQQAATGAGSISREQGLTREGDVLSRAGQQLDDFIERGRLALGDLGDQNQLLRNTQRTMQKAASTLGISSDTVRKVERRLKEDKIVFYGGIAVMIFLFWLILRWFR